MSKHSALVTRLLDHSTLRVPAIPEWLRADLIEAADVIAELSKPITQSADVIPWGVWHSATHAAKDSDGESRLYNCEPYIDEAKGRWMGKDAAAPYGRWATLEFGDRSDCRIHGPWRDSLRKRPEGV